MFRASSAHLQEDTVVYMQHMVLSLCMRVPHDNAPFHNTTIVKQFLAQRKVTVFDHPPYSSDLAPAD